MPGLTGITQTAVAALFPSANEPTDQESKWHQPLSEPVRHKIAPQLAVALVASGLAFVGPTPVTDAVEARWHQGWSEPVRVKLGLPAGEQAFLAFVEAAPFAEIVTESRWHQPFSEPVRTRWFPPAEQQALAFSPQVFGAAQSGWSRPPPSLTRAQYQVLAPDPLPRVSFSWFASLSEPVRLKPGLRAGHQQPLAWQPAPSPFVASGWFNWLTEPVRVKAALPVVEQHVFEFEPTPIIKIDWFGPFAEPVRIKPGLAAGAHQFLALQPTPIISIAWAPAFSEPVRIKPGLIAAPQPYEVSYDVLPLPFLGGGGGWYLPGFAEATPGKPAVARRAKAGAPRQVAPKVAPPSFAEVIGSQQPTRLADVLGSAFAPQLAALPPPALDLWLPPRAPDTTQKVSIPPGILDAAADHVDAIDAAEALHALDMLERQEHEALIAMLLHLASSE